MFFCVCSPTQKCWRFDFAFLLWIIIIYIFAFFWRQCLTLNSHLQPFQFQQQLLLRLYLKKKKKKQRFTIKLRPRYEKCFLSAFLTLLSDLCSPVLLIYQRFVIKVLDFVLNTTDPRITQRKGYEQQCCGKYFVVLTLYFSVLLKIHKLSHRYQYVCCLLCK